MAYFNNNIRILILTPLRAVNSIRSGNFIIFYLYKNDNNSLHEKNSTKYNTIIQFLVKRFEHENVLFFKYNSINLGCKVKN